jgi:hypothetical protein
MNTCVRVRARVSATLLELTAAVAKRAEREDDGGDDDDEVDDKRATNEG